MSYNSNRVDDSDDSWWPSFLQFSFWAESLSSLISSFQAMLNGVFSSTTTTTTTTTSSQQSSSNLSPIVFEKLEKLKRHFLQSYDQNNESHEQQLLSLWKSAFPNEQLSNRKSSQWKKLGFQGTDPVKIFSDLFIC